MQKLLILVSLMMIFSLFIINYYYENHQNLKKPRLQHSINEQSYTNKPNKSQTLNRATSDKISYSLQNNKLHITYDGGGEWKKVPIEKERLFAGEYNGNKEQLITGSYLLSENRVGFLYSIEKGNSTEVVFTSSVDKGKTWEDSMITDTFPFLRFRKIEFLNDQFGYAILSGDRTMSQEYSNAYTTHDGGATWNQATNTGVTRLLADGGFINEKTGFMSYGTINPVEPDLYVTEDGGNTWTKSIVNIPEKYDQIFVQAEIPFKDESQLSVLINQGPNGDYLGGKVKGKFTSVDNGKTWSFSTEVQPNETE
ncbi:oxidoreductase [Metabacillus malikii]|uniref:Photosystem II stability/assembly factor-like uncharacterized protein n=1 Tax=Metabacillus malikii TaxID=1504265 RepID=A0ABT9ZM48_9BACI|nr:oxidoreductase [Metabacillus malikii]MDQ0233348.1 photosystem II stability/assembly factor-like uncharacterized protein [Metabacillus malikii]